MKAEIHPELFECRVSCSGCGTEFTTFSTRSEIRVEVCSQCHPFFTGKQARIVDTEGRVEKFVKKFEGKEARVSKRKRKQASAEAEKAAMLEREARMAEEKVAEEKALREEARKKRAEERAARQAAQAKKEESAEAEKAARLEPGWREKRVWPKRRRKKRRRSEKKPSRSGLRSAPPGKRPRRRKKNPSRPKRPPWPRMLHPILNRTMPRRSLPLMMLHPTHRLRLNRAEKPRSPRTHKPGASRVCPGDCPWAVAPRQTRIHGPGFHAGPLHSPPVG